MTTHDKDALLREAKGVIESLDAIISGEISREWADHFGKDYEDMATCISRITAALAEKVEPVATWEMVHEAVKIAIDKCKDASGMRNSIDTFVNAIQITHDVMGTDTIPAPADHWRMVEDGLPHTDHPMRHYDRTCPACNTALPEGE